MSLKPVNEPPVFDFADELIKYQDEHPEESNYIEKPKLVSENYFAAIKSVKRKEKRKRPESPLTNSETTKPLYAQISRSPSITVETRKTRDVGRYIIEVKPLIKYCVVL